MSASLRTALRHAWFHGLLITLGCLAWFVYMPGLKGPFVFDDFGSLPALGAGGPVHDSASFLRYATSGKADPTGRPLATISFLIDAQDWPAQPDAFKRTNVLIHLINGALLAWFLAQLGETLGTERERARLAALLAAGMWMLNPMLVSTVLYVVQREAMLPATFMLLAGLCWLRARSQHPPHISRATAWLVLGTGGCTALAVLSKANGAVIPILILACEWALPSPADPRIRRRATLLLAPPSAILLAWLGWMALAGLGEGVLSYRGWSVGQRLLTEPAILWQYLGQLWLVVPTNTSVLHDGAMAATGLTSPWYTLPAIAGCLGLLAVATRAWRASPSLALAIVFFFAGHVMESTSIPLELYFDHRNYLPAMLMFWPLAQAVTQLTRRAYALTAALTLVAGSATLTWQNASLWGDPYKQAIVWAADNPDSARSQAYAAQVAAANGKHEVSRSVISAAVLRFRGEPQIALTNIDLKCRDGAIDPADLSYASASLQHAVRDPGGMLLNWFDRAITTVRERRCEGLDAAAIVQLINTALANPAIRDVPGRHQDLDHARGQLALSQGDIDAAARWFDNALRDSPTPEAALGQAAALGTAGRPDLGLAHLDLYARLPAPPLPLWSQGMMRIHALVVERQNYWPQELAHLRASLQAATPTASP